MSDGGEQQHTRMLDGKSQEKSHGGDVVVFIQISIA